MSGTSFTLGLLGGLATYHGLGLVRSMAFKELGMRGRMKNLSLLFAPKDLHHPLFEVPLIEAGPTFRASAFCTHQYLGNYEIGLICQRGVSTGIENPIEVKFTCEWHLPDGAVVRICDGPVKLSEAWFDGPDRAGFSLARYRVPDEVRVNQRVRLSVAFQSQEVFSTYGEMSIYARNIDIL